MERVFRQDYTPLNKAFKIHGGEKAVVVEVNKPDVKISVNEKSYTIPYRDFIVITKLRN